MKFVAEIDVMPHKELLDPQGKTVSNNLKHIDISGVEEVRIGKHIRLVVAADDETSAKAKVDTACQKMFINPIMENYTFTLKAV
jgi:phosphoribosylformylglycinamidine synthase subunit PurS